MVNITGLAYLRGTGADLALAATSRTSGIGIWRLKPKSGAPTALRAITRRLGSDCLHLALSPDSELAAYIDFETSVKVWDVVRARALAFSGPPALLGWHSLGFCSPHDLVYISRDRVAVVWDITANRLARTIGRPGTFEGFHVAVSPDGRWLAAEVTPSSVAIVDLERGEIIFTFREERSPTWSLAWSPDARRLAVGLADGGLVVWDLERDPRPACPVRHRCPFDVGSPGGAPRCSSRAGSRPRSGRSTLPGRKRLESSRRGRDGVKVGGGVRRLQPNLCRTGATTAPIVGRSTPPCASRWVIWRDTAQSAETWSRRCAKTTNECG